MRFVRVRFVLLAGLIVLGMACLGVSTSASTLTGTVSDFPWNAI
jgi:hypothetical protein